MASSSPKPIRCAIYTRVSTADQARGDFSSIDNQRARAEQVIATHAHDGWQVIDEHFDDCGISGGTIDRPALQRLVRAVKAGQVDIIVTYKLDRLSRALRDLLAIIDLLRDYDVALVSVTEPFDTTNSIGKAMLQLIGVFAELERGMISERTRDKVVAAIQRGQYVGGPIPLGYDIHPDGGKLIPNEQETEIVQAIFRLYLEKQSLAHTLRELHRRGWKTKSWTTKTGKLRNGSNFTKESLRRLLTNPRYIGKVKHDGQVYDGEHDAIVDKVLWTRVQKMLKNNAQASGAAVRNTQGALLKGIIRCSCCDSAMSHNHYQRKGRVYRYYVCIKAQKNGWATCPSKSLPAADLDAFVVERLKGMGKNPELVEQTLKAARKQHAEHLKVLRASLKRHLDERDRLQTEELDLLKVRMEGGDARTSVAQRMAEIEARTHELDSAIANAEEEIEVAERMSLDPDDLRRAIEAFDGIWDVLSPRERAHVVRLLVERVEFNGETGKVSVTFRPLGARLLLDELADEGAAA